ncbi:MAG: outer membrane receptor protein [Desulfuromonas sp.]|nr:MAG: outer membrane receptor protein [Desulfuromonas sp.]
MLRKLILFLLPLLLLSVPMSLWAQEEILELDLESLMEIQVISAGRKQQNLMDVPAAIYVITAEDIKNSGATSVPEALRMVPGLQVSRIGSSKWAIASRGFNGTFSNKLLVQIDGRSVYSPTYSGVYWDVQNVLLDDIDRIEVIRGPGATLWGANAVNGIINIITKPASDTLGGVVSVGSGNHEEQLLNFRYGVQLSKNVYGRFTINHIERDEFRYHADHSDSLDDWRMTYGGFRLDGDINLQDSWTLQGDIYSGREGQQVYPYWTPESPYASTADDRINADGYNLLARWEHKFSPTSSWTLQSYFDFSDRDEIYVGQMSETFDIDFQHRFQLGERQDIVWGLGYRTIKDDFSNTYMVSFLPKSDRSELLSGFIQDEIRLIDDTLWLTLGSKVENNDYTGTGYQPSAKLLWKPTPKQSVWTSVSRALRTPSRAEATSLVVTNKIPLPPTYTTAYTMYINGNDDMDAEQVTAYELGYRYARDSRLSFDLSLFYNRYKKLTSYSYTFLPSGLPASIEFANDMSGHSHGFEALLKWNPTDWLETELSYSLIRLSMAMGPESQGSPSVMDIVAEKSSPQHQLFLHGGFKLRDNLRLNLWGRYVDSLDVASPVAAVNGDVVDSYLAVDANLIWDITENLELMLSGQNLFDDYHLEFINEYFTPAIDIGRSLYAKVTWSF